MPAINIHHHDGHHRFEAVVDGHACRLEYSLAEGRMVILHTEVPAEVGGRGIAAQLVGAALDWARASGLRVVAQCAYAAGYVARHREYDDIIDPA